MKHNLAIGGCVFALFAIATALVYFTLSPVAMLTTAQNKTAGYNWYFKPRDDGLQRGISSAWGQCSARPLRNGSRTGAVSIK